MAECHAVTGPFSYTGSYIARRLLQDALEVRGFVRRPDSQRDQRVDCRPLQFADPERLSADLEGVSVLYNTYWIRFERGEETFQQTVENTAILTRAASTVGVRRIVHLSVSNPSADSPFAYFRGKAAAEEAIRQSGVSASIIRPTLVFGWEDILLNNITWLLRRFHLLALPGNGECRVQPVFVGDVAALAIAEARADGDRVLDAAGPSILSFRCLCELLAEAAKAKSLLVPSPPSLALVAGGMLSKFLSDVVITREELGALMAETLISHGAPTAPTRISDWLAENGSHLGRSYTSELQRHWSGRS